MNRVLAAADRERQRARGVHVVDRLLDVSAFAGHITCDARSRSEIVVPVFHRTGDLIAVLDIDSTDLATFDDEDRKQLELWVARFAGS